MKDGIFPVPETYMRNLGAEVPEKKEAQSDILLEIGQAAKTIGVSPSTLRNWEAKGRISATRTPSGRRKYRRDDVLALRRPESSSVISTASNEEEREAAIELVNSTYSSAAAATLLNVSLETLRRWRDSGLIKAHERRLHGQIIYPRETIDNMIAAQQGDVDLAGE